jgi:uncharacterized membrane protein
MPPQVKKYPWTIISIVVTIILYVLIITIDFEIFEVIIEWMQALEDYEVDEIFLAIVLILLGLSTDLRRSLTTAQSEQKVAEERLSIFQATMRTVHDLLGNFLNSLQLFKMEAEDSKAMSPETLKRFDDEIFSVANTLHRLGDIDVVVQKEISPGLNAVDIEASHRKNDSPKR